MAFRRNKQSHLPWRMGLWFIVAVAVALAFLTQTPLPVDVELPAETPVELTRDTPSDVLVVVDWDAIRNSPPTFSQRDFSAAWINTFEQEVGPVTIATPATLNARLLDEARVIVLTHSVAANVPATITRTLREMVLAGRVVLVVERPEGELRERFGANGRVGEQRGHSISWVRDLQDPTRELITQTPVNIEYVGSTTPKENATTWMSVDGAPVVYSVAVGQGQVVVVDFDLGEFLVATQQGRPTETFEVPGETTASLATLPDGQRFPIADAVERLLVHGVIGRLAPLPAFWPYPAGAEGTIVAVRSDTALGNGGAWMLRYEALRKGSSSLLSAYDSGLDAEGKERIDKLGGDLGLLWRMQGTPAAAMEAFGIGPIRPFARPMTLEAQLAAMNKVVDANPTSAMVAEFYWTRDWAAPLQALSSQSIRVDTSYTPGTHSGYRFGTGLPFLALDETGLPLSIREYPIVVPFAPQGGPEMLDLLQDSQDFNHQNITVYDIPASFADFPDIARFETWITMFDLAETFAHPVMSAAAFDGFLRTRRSSAVRARTLVQKNEDGTDAHILRITVDAKRGDLELMLPETVRFGDITKAFLGTRQKVNRVGDELVSGEIESNAANYGGITVRRLRLDSGFNTIDAFYGEPEAILPMEVP